MIVRSFPVLFILVAFVLESVAGPLEVPVHTVASDAVFLGAGVSSGLAVGMRGTLISADGRQAELEILFVSALRSSCQLIPASAAVKVGDVFTFTLPDSVSIAPAAPLKTPLESATPPPASAKSQPPHGLRAQGWWRANLNMSQGASRSGQLVRQALGLRISPARTPRLQLALQVRGRQEWGDEKQRDTWVDELALSGPAPGGRMSWQAGRLADGRNALSGPLDGLALQGEDARTWTWGLSTGSRPGSADNWGDRAMGAGARMRYRNRDMDFSSDLKSRWERDAAGMGTAGVSWGNQFRVTPKVRLEQWFRIELSERSDWKKAQSRFSSTRISWRGRAWRSELRHQMSLWPAQTLLEQPLGPPIGNNQAQQVVGALSREFGPSLLALQVRGRGAQLDGDMERVVDVSLSRGIQRGAIARADISSQFMLGPRDKGLDLELRTVTKPWRGLDMDLSARWWSLDQGQEKWTGWNTGIFTRGRLWRSTRWEAGGTLQHLQGEWHREVRVGLRGDLIIRPLQKGR